MIPTQRHQVLPLHILKSVTMRLSFPMQQKFNKYYELQILKHSCLPCHLDEYFQGREGSWGHVEESFPLLVSPHGLPMAASCDGGRQEPNHRAVDCSADADDLQ